MTYEYATKICKCGNRKHFNFEDCFRCRDKAIRKNKPRCPFCTRALIRGKICKKFKCLSEMKKYAIEHRKMKLQTKKYYDAEVQPDVKADKI